MADEQERIEDSKEVPLQKIKRRRRILNIVTTTIFGILVVFDLIMFIVGYIKWYMFAMVIILFVAVYPFVVIMLGKLQPTSRTSEKAQADQKVVDETKKDLSEFAE